MVSDLELELLLAQPTSRNVVHRDFRLWLIVPTEAIDSLPGEELPPTGLQIGVGRATVLC